MSLSEIPPGIPATGKTMPAEPDGTCRHCGLDVPAARRERDNAFCCSGCERVYELLHESGLERYYELRPGDGVPPLDAGAASHAWLEPMLETARGADAPVRLRLDLQGIHCAACVWLLETTFRRLPGAVDLRINPALGSADLVWIPDRGDLAGWLAEAEAFGYRFGPETDRPASRSRSLLLRLGLSAALATQTMMFGLAYYLGLSPENGPIYSVLGWLGLVLAAAAVVIGGGVFLRTAWQGLRHRVAHLDLPIAVGIILAFGGSVLAFFRQGPEAAYFDSVTVFITLMLAGRWLQERILERNRNALLGDSGVGALFTRLVRGGRVAIIPATEIRRGDELRVVAGDIVPVLGVAVEHKGRIALDWITGESEPQAVRPGETIPAGARNVGERPIHLAAQEDFAESRLHTLLRPTATDDDATRDPGARWWDRLARVYAAAVFVLAAGGFALWIDHGLDRALQVTVAVLVVTCPCALGIAVPLAQELTHRNLRRRGVFLRLSRFLDRALRVRKVIFDKTGTLTLGALIPTPSSMQALEGLDPAAREVLAVMTAQSNHPVSRALLTAVAEPAPRDSNVIEHPGDGLELEDQGSVWRLGRREFAAPDAHLSTREHTVFSRDGRVLAGFRFEEVLKEDAADELLALREEGVDVYLLSGDRDDKVASLALRLGLPGDHIAAGMTPENKAEWVERHDHRDTLFVGDGINDGPAFTRAYTAATPAVDHPSIPAKADFYFLGQRMAGVRAALGAARRLRRVIHGNLAFAVAYNAAALTLCYLGLVRPLTAAILMPLSSVIVIGLTTFRLRERKSS